VNQEGGTRGIKRVKEKKNPLRFRAIISREGGAASPSEPIAGKRLGEKNVYLEPCMVYKGGWAKRWVWKGGGERKGGLRGEGKWKGTERKKEHKKGN